MSDDMCGSCGGFIDDRCLICYPLKQGGRGPDKKPRKRRKGAPRVRIQLSLTPQNAAYVRMYPDSNSAFINRLLESHRGLL